MHNLKMILWTVIYAFLLFATVFAEFYTSLALLETLIEAEKAIPAIINGYVEKELERLDYLKKFVQEVQDNNDKSMTNSEEAIRHPINAFLLIKEMIKGWNKALKIMRLNSANDVIRNFTRQKVIKRLNYPTEHELFYSARTIDPDHPRAKGNIKGYKVLLKNNRIQSNDMQRDILSINNIRQDNEVDEGVLLTYETLCRQEVHFRRTTESWLYCYYKMDHPYLRLAPFKVEVVRQNPLVVLFYDIMSDEESRVIQMLAEPKACLVLLFVLCAYLKSMEHETVKRIDRRLELATNLKVETAEDLQMTEPEIGGRTVFLTNLKISVSCIKVSCSIFSAARQ
ncbi:prolyl 4-Hydroxylase alpha-subunit, region [Onchocerca flexuosa]|uniref:Prolyl 4-Hydroxylase alpha-subunit, region n=1 Tax=Onchocerca flexuosa TaxID=387005 RepID=A0A238BNN0_9BILA|nr:prolyl 4-Hydroxylase alpha-subunit, region [Onchocerca flexuosa]